MLFLASVGLLLSPVTGMSGPAPWSQYGGNAQHTALSMYPMRRPERVLWSTSIDLAPQYSGDALLIHYGSPLITGNGTAILSVKTGASDGFEYRAFSSVGTLRFILPTDYSLPPHDWTPSCGGALVLGSSYCAFPAAGGTLLLRNGPEAMQGQTVRTAFYGTSNYAADPDTYNANVKICSPLMSTANGSVYFGFRTFGATSTGLQSGIASYLPWLNHGNWVSAAAAAGDANIVQPVMNCTPAASSNGRFVYAVVSSGNWGYGYLLCLDPRTLQTINKVRLKDPDGNDAPLPDAGTASPMVGPDGDVYFGVLENPFPYNHDRGWMLHYNADLTVQKPTGAFGWDDTASVVPSSCVPSYFGASRYLILTKYNNYAGVGGDGINKLAILDPNDSQLDPITGQTVMKEILTVAGPTPDEEFVETHPDAVREWCINTAAVDPFNGCAVVNSEDGKCYRWNFRSNSLDRTVTLTSGVGEAYTPTVIGPSGISYAVNNATVFAIGGSR